MQGKLLSDTVVYTLLQVVMRLRTLILLPVLATRVGPEGYGVYVQITLAITFLAPIFGLKLETAAVRFLAAEEDPQRFANRFATGMGALVLTSGTLLAVLIVFSRFGAFLLLADSSLEEYVQVGGVNLVSTIIFAYLVGYYRIRQRIKFQSALMLMESVVEIGTMLGVLVAGYSLLVALWGMVAVRTVLGAGIGIAVFCTLHRPRWSNELLSEMMRYSIPLIPNGFIRWIVNYGDRLIIIQLLGLSFVGVYSATYSLGMALNLLAMPFGYVLFPLLSQLWDSGNSAMVRTYLGTGTRVYLMVAIPACVGLGVLSNPLLKLLATEAFAAEASLTFWIAVGIALNGLFQFNVYVFHLTHRTKAITTLLLVSAVLNIVLNILLVPTIGLLGAAIATALTYFILAFFAIVSGRRLIVYSVNWNRIVRSLPAAAIMGAAIRYLSPSHPLAIAGSVVLGLVIYVLTFFLLGGVTKREIKEISRVVRQTVS